MNGWMDGWMVECGGGMNFKRGIRNEPRFFLFLLEIDSPTDAHTEQSPGPAHAHTPTHTE